MKWILFLIALGFGLPLIAEVPAGKHMTDRTISHEVIVNASRENVFELWVNEEGIKKFFGLSAEVENKLDGKYFIYFHQEDRGLSSEGARILRYDPPEFLSFEWRGKPEMVEMNAQPFPTWVEVEFTPGDPQGTKTKVGLHHYGFGKGGTWDQAYSFFDTSWKRVLENLAKLFSKT